MDGDGKFQDPEKRIDGELGLVLSQWGAGRREQGGEFVCSMDPFRQV